MDKKNRLLMKQIERYIDEYTEAHGGGSPTIREIAEAVGCARTTAGNYLQYMRDEGIIYYHGCRNITTRKKQKTELAVRSVPLVGTIACGMPILAEENIEKYLSIPSFLAESGDCFLLRARGESMIEAGINPGDLVVIRQQDTAEPGDIVVALIGSEATLKRFYPEPEKHRVRLHPENKEMDDIYAGVDLKIQGVAVGAIKTFL